MSKVKRKNEVQSLRTQNVVRSTKQYSLARTTGAGSKNEAKIELKMQKKGKKKAKKRVNPVFFRG